MKEHEDRCVAIIEKCINRIRISINRIRMNDTIMIIIM